MKKSHRQIATVCELALVAKFAVTKPLVVATQRSLEADVVCNTVIERFFMLNFAGTTIAVLTSGDAGQNVRDKYLAWLDAFVLAGSRCIWKGFVVDIFGYQDSLHGLLHLSMDESNYYSGHFS